MEENKAVGDNPVLGLSPDADGYYTVVLGNFNVRDGQGQYVPWDAAKHLFEPDSHFMRRAKNGQLMAQWGSPRLEGRSGRRERFLTIDASQVCGQFKDVHAVDGSQNTKRILAKIKPAGPFREELMKTIDVGENITFGMRALVNIVSPHGPDSGATPIKEVVEIISWDLINAV